MRPSAWLWSRRRAGFSKSTGRYCALVGYPEAELLARSFQDITHPSDLAADLANVRRLLAGDISLLSGGEALYPRARTPGHDFAGCFPGAATTRTNRSTFIAQIQDITARKRLQAQLLQSQKMETVATGGRRGRS